MVRFTIFILFVLLQTSNVQAYVGPGLGVGVIGVIFGVIVSILMAILGLFWYPIKRFFKKDKDEETLDDSDNNNDNDEKMNGPDQP